MFGQSIWGCRMNINQQEVQIVVTLAFSVDAKSSSPSKTVENLSHIESLH